jgi:hypothetical protein
VFFLNCFRNATKKFSAFYGNRKCLNILIRLRHSSPSAASWIQSTSAQPIPLRSILTSFFHPWISLFPMDFSTNILHACCIFPMRALYLVTYFPASSSYFLSFRCIHFLTFNPPNKTHRFLNNAALHRTEHSVYTTLKTVSGKVYDLYRTMFSEIILIVQRKLKWILFYSTSWTKYQFPLLLALTNPY